MASSGIFTRIPTTSNGDNMIGFTNHKYMGALSEIDQSTVSSWYRSDMDTNYLGLIERMQFFCSWEPPFQYRLVKDGARIRVNGVRGTFVYDEKVYQEDGIYTVDDMSDQEYAGVDDSIFKLSLSMPFTVGDVLTYDAERGAQVFVSGDYKVDMVGDSYVHYVKLVKGSGFEMFPKDKLKPGIKYVKIGHGLHEYATQFSNVHASANIGTVRNEFVLGNHRGVEGSVTMYGNTKLNNQSIDRIIDTYDSYQTMLGRDGNDRKYDVVLFGTYVDMARNDRTAVGDEIRNIQRKEITNSMSLMEALVLAELMRIESNQLMFQAGGVINDTNGVVRLNEGYWRQLRRGFLIGYNRPGGITKDHLATAVGYIYQGSNIPIDKRRVSFEGGYFAVENVRELYTLAAASQLANIPHTWMGNTRALPQSPVSGPLDDLKLEKVAIGEAFLQGIGWVNVKHNPSLDNMPFSDRFSQGFYGNSFARTSYTLIIEDKTSASSTNLLSALPANTRVVGTNQGANLYYVTPEVDALMWGHETGRWSNTRTSNIASTARPMAESFFAHNVSAVWMRDKSRSVIIELSDNKDLPRYVA